MDVFDDSDAGTDHESKSEVFAASSCRSQLTSVSRNGMVQTTSTAAKHSSFTQMYLGSHDRAASAQRMKAQILASVLAARKESKVQRETAIRRRENVKRWLSNETNFPFFSDFLTQTDATDEESLDEKNDEVIDGILERDANPSPLQPVSCVLLFDPTTHHVISECHDDHSRQHAMEHAKHQHDATESANTRAVELEEESLLELAHRVKRASSQQSSSHRARRGCFAFLPNLFSFKTALSKAAASKAAPRGKARSSSRSSPSTAESICSSDGLSAARTSVEEAHTQPHSAILTPGTITKPHSFRSSDVFCSPAALWARQTDEVLEVDVFESADGSRRCSRSVSAALVGGYADGPKHLTPAPYLMQFKHEGSMHLKHDGGLELAGR
mmetsp:Transcript_9827/g.19592  ORF Transcript_9827/g.19592 Transcript_9827/m.19592 type:complete len:385 (+) Transcript_9827:203-1357(+)|eukprot:CAMPEP_0181310226 /NCGR_PEP_ID=MMETSP1101-20121128/12470_1 /TAXON_ID=46948 /ORGANISM="Rhodomonas abbreviata, Strain Caron Lab Isolate" /LENGTH=384 /DNA_ID=CAMNT_0023416835 /DNA_START=202 /DNA_END=1356 /DNA_ORIENTATION=-